MKRVAVLACVAACLPVALGSASAKPRWVATQLGTLSFPGTYGIDSASVAVNAHGDVLGASGFLSFRATGATPLRRAFLWTSGRMIDLGTLGGSVTDGAAVNDAGTVVGSSTTRAGAMHAFLWRAGKMTDLGTLGGKSSAAAGINDRGQVVGWADVSGSSYVHAFLWEQGRMTDLGTLGGAQSGAVAINERGQVVGWSETEIQGQSHAFLWQSGKMTDLGALDGEGSTATAINDRGQVIGMISSLGSETPFVWRNGKTTLLPTGPDFTRVTAINNRGEILGEAQSPRPGAGPGHVLLWRNRKLLDLGDGTAGGIDDRGDVVGITNGPRGVTYGRAILWQSGRRIVLGAEPSGRNNPNDSDVFGAVDINSKGDEIAATLRRPDGHTRAIVWRLK